MGQIQSSVGLISGINIDDTVSKLIALAAQPRTRLENRTKSLQSQQGAVNELLSLTIGAQLSTDRLGRVADFNTISATSSNKEVLTASASQTAAVANYSFKTVQLAKASAYASNTFTSSSQTLTEGEVTVRTGGFVDGATRLEDLRGGEGIDRGKIQITDRSGESREVDLRFAVSIEDVVSKINSTSGIKVSAKISGDQIVLTDISGSTVSNLKVEDKGETHTASHLGLGGVNVASNTATGSDLVYLGNGTQISSLRDGRGLRFGRGDDLSITLRDGTKLTADLNNTKDGNPATVGQLLERLNAVSKDKLQAKISSSGDSIELVDLTSGTEAFAVTDKNGLLAQDLGLDKSTSQATISGKQVQPGLQGPSLESLKGGKGIGTLGKIDVTNRSGTTTQVDLSSAKTLRDVIDKINGANAGVIATLNNTKTGIAIQDSTGSSSSNLKIANADSTNSAAKLNLVTDIAKSTLDAASLDLQFVHENTKLSDLNQGKGIRLGTLSIKDSSGAKSSITLTASNAKTVGDVIQAFNDLSIGVEASLNESGDGIVIIDTANGKEDLTVTDVGAGSAAKDLGIAETSSAIEFGGESKKGIITSQNVKFAVKSGDTLASLITSIKEKNGPIAASLLNLGPNSVRLLINSKESGRLGRVAVDGGSTGLSLSVTAQASDAAIAIGASDESGGSLITSSSNTFKEVVTGLSVTASGLTEDPVQVTVNSSASTVTKNVQGFVDQFNKVLDKIRSLTSFDAATKSTGILFGSTETLRIEIGLSKLVSSRLNNAGTFKSLSELGVKISSEGKIEFDKAKFEEKLAENPQSVQDFFTKEKTGFSAKAKELIEGLSGVDKSLLVNRTNVLQKQVETNQKRIESMTLRLDRQKTALQKQFYGLEQTISKLQQNQKSISGIGTVRA